MTATRIGDIITRPLLPSVRPLSGFLQSHRIGTDKTLFLTIADKNFLGAALHFKSQLDRQGLGDSFVILCLDDECLKGAEGKSLAYDGFVFRGPGDWHTPVAKMKVRIIFPLKSANTDLFFFSLH
jgi:hypothetical protein